MKKRKITKRWLRKKYACEEAVESFCKQDETDTIKLIKLMIRKKKFRWADWLITRVLEEPDRLGYAIHAAESVLHIYEDAYPDCDKPRKAIYAAKIVLNLCDGKTKTKPKSAYKILRNAIYASKAAYRAADKTTSKVVSAAATSAAGCAAGSAAGCTAGCAAASCTACGVVGCTAGYTAGCVTCNVVGCAAVYATNCAIYAASYSLDALASRKLQAKMVKYGLNLLEKEEGND